MSSGQALSEEDHHNITLLLSSEQTYQQLLALHMVDGGLYDADIIKKISYDPELVLLCLKESLENILQEFRFLYIRRFQLQALPLSTRHLQNLIMLDLGYNQFIRIPLVIFELTGLKKLRMAHNQIHHLTPQIRQLAGLEELDLSFNILQDFPPEIMELKQLKKLDISACSFSREKVRELHRTLPHTEIKF
ncbi:MAG: leucine-rich repeat domain-containing protein [Bacteroidota bacterium]